MNKPRDGETEVDYGNRLSLCGLFVVIDQLAGPEYQNSTRTPRDEGYPSYSDALEAVFDAYRIDDFVAGDGLRYGLTQGQLDMLGEFARAFNLFNEQLTGSESDHDILMRPDWVTVVTLARRLAATSRDWCVKHCQDSIDYQDARRRKSEHS